MNKQLLPVVPHFPFTLPDRSRRLVREYAQNLLKSGIFQSDAIFREHVVETLGTAPALLVDDFTDIALFDPSSLFLEQRARLRAQAGDVVATILPANPAFDRYVSEGLQLGDVDWLQVDVPPGRTSLANHCWRNRNVRRDLVHAIRSRGLEYIHPHMGNSNVWRLAQLLSKTAHRNVRVIAPPPAVSHWANDKVAFAKIVNDLVGTRYVPATRSAHCRSVLAQQVKELAQESRHLGLKVPHAAGGRGIVMLDSEPLRSQSLSSIDCLLRQLVPADHWPDNTTMLVDVWEDQVLESASIQTWIPPVADGEPLLEGIFAQMIEGGSTKFVGCMPLELPDTMQSTIIEATSILVKLFQLVGYVGRCSFDFLLVGNSMETAQVEFIECNARWGGTSVPMTLVNRLFGDTARQPFAVVATDNLFENSNTGRISFDSVLTGLSGDLYRKLGDCGDMGWLIPFNPGRMEAHDGLNWIVLGSDASEIRKRIYDLPRIIKQRIVPGEEFRPQE